MAPLAADELTSNETAAALLAGVAPKARQILEQSAIKRRLDPGELLFRQGDLPSHLFLLTDGRVKVWRALIGGGALTLALLARGAPLGTLGTVRATPHTATATTQTSAEVIAWPIQEVRAVMMNDRALMANLLLIVTNYAEQMIDRLEEVSTVSVEQRLARTLLRVAHNPFDDDIPIGEALLLSRQDLADLTSTTLPTVSRIMSRWRERGLIDGGRSRVVVLDRTRLLRLADLPEDWIRPLQSALAMPT